MQKRKRKSLIATKQAQFYIMLLLAVPHIANSESIKSTDAKSSVVSEETGLAQQTEGNVYIDRVGSSQAPDSSVNANWVGNSDNPVQAEVNTDLNYVRSGTTSIKSTSTLSDGAPRNIRFEGLSASAVAGDIVTLNAWFKAENTVRAYVALQSPITSFQSGIRGNGDWQQITFSQVSDGGETKFFLVSRGDAVSGPHDVYWDDIDVTISRGNDTT